MHGMRDGCNKEGMNGRRDACVIHGMMEECIYHGIKGETWNEG